MGICMASQTVRAEETEAEEPRWIPSFNVAFDVGDYDPDVSVDSSVGQSGADDDAFDNLVFRLGGELMSPILGELPGSPRLFARAGAGLVADTKVVTLEVGEVGAPEDEIQGFYDDLADAIADGCETNDPPDCPTADPGDFDGQGSDIRATFSQPKWYAGVGVAFTIPLPSDTALRIKPSAEYTGERIEQRGRVTSVTETSPDVFLVNRSVETTTTTDHLVGPGLELEFLLKRSARPIAFSIYVDSRFLWLVSDQTTQFSGLTENPDDNPTGSATYTVERDSMDIRAGAGVRLSWMGLGAD
jgi:hypothetical protein